MKKAYSNRDFINKVLDIIDAYTGESIQYSIGTEIENGKMRYRVFNEPDHYSSHKTTEAEKDLLKTIKALLKKDLQGLLENDDYQMKSTYHLANISMKKELLSAASTHLQMSALIELIAQRRPDANTQLIYSIKKSIQDEDNIFDEQSVSWAVNTLAKGFDLTKSKNSENHLLGFYKALSEREFRLTPEKYDTIIQDNIFNSQGEYESFKESQRKSFIEYLQTFITNPEIRKTIFQHVLIKNVDNLEIREELKASTILYIPVEETVLKYSFLNADKAGKFFSLVRWHLENEASFIGLSKVDIADNTNELSLILISEDEKKPDTLLIKRVINTALNLHKDWISENPTKNMSVDVYREDLFAINNIIAMEKINLEMEKKYGVANDFSDNENSASPKMKI